ncbi:hypothetical protein C3942_17425 [Solimonas fluminis]|uniref:TIGR02301 family protein n=1 Tax=Solimonas fluminis TaxID=2086571 RepID=A0A2S5TC24_9GAMM|nr:hypothetical protein C3942_17425 [Solimonas fluminis]
MSCRTPALLAGVVMPLLALQATAAPLPPPPPTGGTLALIEQCTAAMSRAHPWRARQLRQAMFRMRVSMSYRAAGARLSAAERRSAMAAERASYDLLFETCRPLLALSLSPARSG